MASICSVRSGAVKQPIPWPAQVGGDPGRVDKVALFKVQWRGREVGERRKEAQKKLVTRPVKIFVVN